MMESNNPEARQRTLELLKDHGETMADWFGRLRYRNSMSDAAIIGMLAPRGFTRSDILGGLGELDRICERETGLAALLRRRAYACDWDLKTYDNRIHPWLMKRPFRKVTEYLSSLTEAWHFVDALEALEGVASAIPCGREPIVLSLFELAGLQWQKHGPDRNAITDKLMAMGYSGADAEFAQDVLEEEAGRADPLWLVKNGALIGRSVEGYFKGVCFQHSLVYRRNQGQYGLEIKILNPDTCRVWTLGSLAAAWGFVMALRNLCSRGEYRSV